MPLTNNMQEEQVIEHMKHLSHTSRFWPSKQLLTSIATLATTLEARVQTVIDLLQPSNTDPVI